MRMELALSVGLIVTSLAGSGCSESPSIQAADATAPLEPPSEVQLKLRALARHAQPPALPLQVEGLYPRIGEERSSGLKEAFFVRYWPGRGVVMASGRIQRLTLLNQDFSAHRHWSERLENTPSNIEVLDDGVLVDAGGSLLHLDPEGIPGKAFHTFLDIFDLVTGPGDQIWINPDLTPIPSERALLLRLNRLGQRTGEAGRRSQDDKWKGLLDRVFLAAGPGRIAAVHAIMPQLRIFDSSTGRELAKTRIDHPSFAFMAQAYDWPYYDRSKRSLRAPRYTAGAAALDDRLYVLLHLPDPEIIEFSWEGEELRRWRLRDLGFQAFDYGGFDVRRSEGKLKWVTSVVHRYQEDDRRHYQPRVLEVSFRASEAGQP